MGLIKDKGLKAMNFDNLVKQLTLLGYFESDLSLKDNRIDFTLDEDLRIVSRDNKAYLYERDDYRFVPFYECALDLESVIDQIENLRSMLNQELSYEEEDDDDL